MRSLFRPLLARAFSVLRSCDHHPHDPCQRIPETRTGVLLLGAVPPHRQLRSDANVRNVIVIVCDNYVFHPVKVGCHLIALKITATDRSCVRPINCTPDIAAGLRSLLLSVAYGPLNTAVCRWWTWRVLPPRLRLASVDRITIIVVSPTVTPVEHIQSYPPCPKIATTHRATVDLTASSTFETVAYDNRRAVSPRFTFCLPAFTAGTRVTESNRHLSGFIVSHPSSHI